MAELTNPPRPDPQWRGDAAECRHPLAALMVPVSDVVLCPAGTAMALVGRTGLGCPAFSGVNCAISCCDPPVQVLDTEPGDLQRFEDSAKTVLSAWNRPR